jgi:DNA-binding transcriptional regulator YiaG
MTRKISQTAQTFRTAREKLGLTQADLAKILGTNQANIANYETGRVWPPGDLLLRVVQMLDPEAKIPSQN